MIHAYLSIPHCCTAFTVIPLLPKATFTHPSIQPNCRLASPCTPLTSTILPYSTYPLSPHFQTISILCDPVFPVLLHTFPFLILYICHTPTKFLEHFISRTFTFFLSVLFIHQSSVLFNTVGTITPDRNFFAFILTLYIPHSFCVLHLFKMHYLLLLATTDT